MHETLQYFMYFYLLHTSVSPTCIPDFIICFTACYFVDILYLNLILILTNTHDCSNFMFNANILLTSTLKLDFTGRVPPGRA